MTGSATNPPLSVILPTYNRAHMLPTMIDSILDQPFADYELIVVDDGSTDQTSEVVLHYVDSRIRYVPYPMNRGAGYARNVGIGCARGRYLTFVDSDDWISGDYLGCMYRGIVSSGMDVAFLLRIQNWHPEIASFDEFIRILPIQLFSTPYKIVCKEFIDTHKLHWAQNLTYGEDSYFWVTTCSELDYIHFLSHSTGRYHVKRTKDSLMRQADIHIQDVFLMKYLFPAVHATFMEVKRRRPDRFLKIVTHIGSRWCNIHAPYNNNRRNLEIRKFFRDLRDL